MIKRITLLFLPLLIIALAAFVPAGCGGKKDASGVAEDYVTLHLAGDFEGAWELLADDSYEKQEWDLDGYVSQSESTYGGPYEVQDLIFKPQGKEGDLVPFIIQGTLVPNSGGEPLVLSGEVSMREVGGEWKVSVIEWAAVPESQVPYDTMN